MHDFLAATIGGALVAFASSLNLLFNGEITGFSGLMNGVIACRPDFLYRVALLSGLMAMGSLIHVADPSFFEPDTAPMLSGSSVFVAGALVGFGTVMGSGCTSGHGICGLARLSIRSIVATCTFVLFAGATCVMIFKIESLRKIVFVENPEDSPAMMTIPNGEAIIAAIAITGLIMSIVRQRRIELHERQLSDSFAANEKDPMKVGGGNGGAKPAAAANQSCGGICATPTTTLQIVVAVAVGAIFAVGMVVSGMINQNKVQRFLNPVHPDGWDASLIFVIAGGVGINLVTFRLIMKRSSPIVKPKFQIPTLTQITPRLVVGSAIFGIAWGLGGMCPAPAIVDMATGRLSFYIWLAGVCFGMSTFNSIVAMFY